MTWRYASSCVLLGGPCGSLGPAARLRPILLLADRCRSRRKRPSAMARTAWAGAAGVQDTHRHRCLCARRAHAERGDRSPSRVTPARRPLCLATGVATGGRPAHTRGAPPRASTCPRTRWWWRHRLQSIAELPAPTQAVQATAIPVVAFKRRFRNAMRWSTRPYPPSRRLRIELSVLTDARIGDGQTSVGLGALSLLDHRRMARRLRGPRGSRPADWGRTRRGGTGASSPWGVDAFASESWRWTS